MSANGTVFKQDIQGIIPSLLERWYAERKQITSKEKEAQEGGDAEEIAFWDKRQLVKKINLNSMVRFLIRVVVSTISVSVNQLLYQVVVLHDIWEQRLTRLLMVLMITKANQ